MSPPQWETYDLGKARPLDPHLGNLALCCTEAISNRRTAARPLQCDGGLCKGRLGDRRRLVQVDRGGGRSLIISLDVEMP